MTVHVKRIYETAESQDGYRILVDRVWPRGVSKEKADLDLWMKEIGPSSDLRKWFGHDPDKFTAFKKKYKEELKTGEQNDALEKLKEAVKENNQVTLLFAAKDEEHNQAQVLKEVLDK